MLVFLNSLSIIGRNFLRILASILILAVPRFSFLTEHNGNKAYKLLFLYNPYHQLPAIKDIISFSLVFYC